MPVGIFGALFSKPLWEDRANAKASAKRQGALQALAEGPEELFGDLQKKVTNGFGVPLASPLGSWPQAPTPSLESCFQEAPGMPLATWLQTWKGTLKAWLGNLSSIIKASNAKAIARSC